MNAPSISHLTAQQLRRAAELKAGIEALQMQLDQILDGRGAERGIRPRAPRKMSAAAIERIRASQRARWARIRAEGGGAKPKAKRRVSAAGRARLSALARARWQKAKAQGRSRL